jgi:hypothetical protein
MTPKTTAVATGDTLETLTLAAAAPPPVLEEILTAQPDRSIAAKKMTTVERVPRTVFRLARTGALG